MARYSEEFKYSIVSKMMPPHNQSVADIAKETGLSEAILYKWQRQASEKGLVVPGEKAIASVGVHGTSSKLCLQTYTLSEVESAESCREKGIYVEQVKAWKDACLQANGGVSQEATRLQKELNRKNAKTGSFRKN